MYNPSNCPKCPTVNWATSANMVNGFPVPKRLIGLQILISLALGVNAFELEA
jgi:hypothetical protein